MTFMLPPTEKDTGWIKLSDVPNYTLRVRRKGDEVHIAIDNWSGVRIDLPVGFGVSDFDGTNWTVGPYIQFSTVSDHITRKKKSPLANASAQAYWNYEVNEKNDLQRAVGQVEINPKNELYLQGTYQSTIPWNGVVPQPNAGNPSIDFWMKKTQTDPQLNTGPSGISIYMSFLTFAPFPSTLPTGV